MPLPTIPDPTKGSSSYSKALRISSLHQHAFSHFWILLSFWNLKAKDVFFNSEFHLSLFVAVRIPSYWIEKKTMCAINQCRYKKNSQISITWNTVSHSTSYIFSNKAWSNQNREIASWWDSHVPLQPHLFLKYSLHLHWHFSVLKYSKSFSVFRTFIYQSFQECLPVFKHTSQSHILLYPEKK